MHAHQSRTRLVDLALDQSEMMRAVELRPIQMQIEIAVLGWQFYHLLQFYQLFADAPMCDQALDRTHVQSVFFAKLHQLRQPRHRAVVVQNFAKHSGTMARLPELMRSEEHTSELQSHHDLVCRLLLEKKNK